LNKGTKRRFRKMAKEVPLIIKNEEETLELLGRHEVTEDLASLKRHICEQLKKIPNSKLFVFLYLKEEEV
jgi:hypothetical protein